MSKSVVLFAAVACLAAGALGAVVATITVAPPPPPVAPVEQRAPSTAAIEREIAELREKNAELLRRVQMLEDRPSESLEPTRAAIAVPPTDAEKKTEEELKGLVAALRDPGAPVPPNLRSTVGSALKSIREDEDRERRDRVAQVAATRIEERLNDLTTKLGLAPSQTQGLRDLYAAQTAKRDELWRTARDSGDFAGARDMMREMRESMDRGLEQILSPAQLEDYKKLDERDPRFDGFGMPRRQRDGNN